MADTYTGSNLLKMEQGTHSGSWGTETNYNLDRIDSMMSGSLTINLGSATAWVLSTDTGKLPTTGTTSAETGGEGWNRVIRFKGSPGSQVTVTIEPAGKPKVYVIWNDGTSQSIKIQYGVVASNAVVLNDSLTLIYGDGTNVYDVFGGYYKAGEALGTPVSGTLTNCTGLPVGGITGTLPVANGGTGAASLTDGGLLLGNGTGAVTVMSVLGDGEMIVGDGTTDPAAESGAALRTSIGVGTGDSPTLTGLTITGTGASSLDVGGGLNIGTDNVALVGTDGKISGPLSGTIIDDLSGANLTNLNGSNISSGTVAAARVATLNQDTTGTAAIATTVTVADESSDTTCFPVFMTGATGNLAPKSGDNLTFNSNTGVLAATAFSGPITGNVTGDVSGSSGSCTGNSATATTATTATNVTVSDESGDTTCYPLFTTAASGNLAPKSGSNLTFNSSSGVLSTLSFLGSLTGNVYGDLSGNAATATALATARAINGVDFDGTGAITVTAAAGTLSGSTLASGVTASSLTSTGTVATGTWGSDITMGSGDNLEVSGGTIKLAGDYPTGASNLVMGTNAAAGFDGTSEENVVIGPEAGRYTGGDLDNCTFVGYKSGMGDSGGTHAGNDNTAFGSCSLEELNGGIGNTFIGRSSGDKVSSGNYNNGFGIGAGGEIEGGVQNICIGGQSGDGIVDGDYNVVIGAYSGDSDGPDYSNKLIINSASSSTNDPATEALIYGDFSAGTLQTNSGHTSNDGLTVNNTHDTYTGDLLKLTTKDAADANFDFIKADADSANQFRVSGVGVIYAQNTTVQSADYADMFEWADGNPDDEDRIGLSVALDGQGGIRIATGADAAEDVVGIVSGTACIVGNSAWNNWDQQFLKDDFGRTTDDLNPDFDESMEYVPRQERQEWAIIGLTGRVHLRKGSPANPSWRKIRDVSAVTEEWLVR